MTRPVINESADGEQDAAAARVRTGEIMASPAELASILHHVGDGITAQGPDGRLIYANDAAARLCGLDSAEEMLALPGAELLERFEILGEDRECLAIDSLPSRRAFVSRAPEESVLCYRTRASGEERWSVVRSTPILTPAGGVQLVINVFRDVTEERDAEARLHFLAEAGSLLSASLDYEATLADLAGLLVPRVADYCIVDALDEEGGLRQVVISHRNPESEELLRELRRRYPPEANDAHPVTQVLRQREPFLVDDAREGELARAAVDEEHLALYEALGAISYIVVPLEARGRLLGTISLGTGESGRRLGATDLEVTHEIARRAALAIDNALLFRAAQESYAQLDTMLRSAPVGIGFWDRDLRFVRVNDALAALNRMSPEEHIGKTLGEVIPTLAPALEPLYRRVLDSGEPVVHTESTDDKALHIGEQRHWLSSYYPVRTADGETIGVGGLIIEITDRKRADDRLRLLAEAGELFSTSLDRNEIAARIAQVAVPRLADTCNVYVRSGGGLVRIACVSDDPALQRALEALPASFALEGPEKGALAQVFATREPVLLSTIPDEYFAELARLGGDPTTFDAIGTRSLMLLPIAARGQPLGVLTLGSRRPGRFDGHDLDLGQELAGRAAVAMDSAQLFRAVESRAQAAQALEFVGDGVFLVGRDGIVRLWNPAASRITGLEEAQVAGAAAAQVLAGWPLDQVGERPQTFPIDGPRGELWLSLTAAEFPHGTVFAFRDLTEERAVEQLKSDFVSTVSHELRTPLAAIYGAAMTLRREDVVLGEEQEEGMLAVIAGESERLARIVNDILLASRLDSGAAGFDIGQTDALEIARAVLAAAETHLPAGIDLALSAPPEGVHVAADADGLRQVLVNLVENAVKYSPEGGRVELELEPIQGRVRFAVRDRGLGIPATEHERIFEKFYRLDPNLSRGVGGTGLGLYICREIVRGMGGRIRVESDRGRGSTFSFELPAAGPETREAA
ncbi:MAG TPA: PAS domain-containing protein [Gaiellaceae bacterium]|nr:PAS domain-containing protein [Gaiellaceae bacterium]